MTAGHHFGTSAMTVFLAVIVVVLVGRMVHDYGWRQAISMWAIAIAWVIVLVLLGYLAGLKVMP
jgi:hypothetical protein